MDLAAPEQKEGLIFLMENWVIEAKWLNEKFHFLTIPSLELGLGQSMKKVP